MAKSFFKPRHNETNFVLSVCMTATKMLVVVILLIMISGIGLLLGVAKAWIETTPELDLNVFNSQAQTSFIYDKYGTLITEFTGTENRIYVSLDEVPQNLIDAVIAIEDARFFEHNGVDVKRIVGAFVQNLMNNSMQGGSTITQQLVKLTMLSSEQTYKRKLQEAYLALQLEEQVSKERILEEYLNTIYLGGSVYGIKAAALDYFGKDLVELSLRECAMLARMIRNPTRYNPRRCYYTLNNPEQCEDGADYVLEQMLAQEYITQAEYDRAMAERLSVLRTSSTSEMYDNAWFVEYAIYDVVTKMLRMENLEDTSANRSMMEQRLRTGGYHIYTTLDPGVQQAVQHTVSTWNKYPSTRYEADAVYRASMGGGEYKDVNQPQTAVTITDWSTGAIVAIIGGRDEPTQRKQLNRAYQMDMPVGSSIKPLSVYGPAIDLGYSPATPVLNLPVEIEEWDSEKGYPSNYGGSSWNGVETLRRAMTKSHNYATAQALFEYVTINNSVAYLKKLGVGAERIDATGFGLALGSSGITPLEMAAAFGAVANSGVYLEPYAFTEVRYSDNRTVYLRASDLQIRQRAFKESTAWLLVDMLEDCVSSSGTGSQARFDGMTVAGKTGTNSDARGVFFAGMTGYYSCAVWIGHDNYRPLASDATGGSYAAPLWAAVMSAAYDAAGITANREINTRSAEEVGLEKASVCAVSGLKPTDACRNDIDGYEVVRDYFLDGTQPTIECNMHRAVTLCTQSHLLPGPYCYSTEVYGILYAPEGHPLRLADDASLVHKYFTYASASRDALQIDTCSTCVPYTVPSYGDGYYYGDSYYGGDGSYDSGGY